MIQIELHDVKWGTDFVPGADNARRLNMLDEGSGIIISVIYGDDPLEQLVREMAIGLTDEQRQRMSGEMLKARPERDNGGSPVERPAAA